VGHAPTASSTSAELPRLPQAPAQSAAFSGAEAGAVAVSIGLAAFPKDGKEPEAVVAAAARALGIAQGRSGDGDASAA